jgi:hypothetical protein
MMLACLMLAWERETPKPAFALLPLNTRHPAMR